MRSMTGYGRINKNIGDYGYNLEIKSLNSKTLNLNVIIPPLFSPIEINIQNFIKKYFQRGRINVYVDIKFLKSDDVIDIDLGLAKAYYNALNILANELHLSGEVNLEILLKFKDIIKVSLTDEKISQIWDGLEKVLEEVIDLVIRFQEEEGKDLEKVIKDYLEEMKNVVEEISKYADKMKETYREHINNNLSSLLSDLSNIDEKRMEMEITLLAERSDITEEIDRLTSHIKRFKNLLETDETSIGQELDFICQEMHREFNTIASKSKLLEITNLSLEGRSLVNKIREQVQNIH
ncbi:MAG TPA: YicC family protein [Defluviitoga sp.]|nr:YicC family protein [Defluviitoga sp.]HOP24826.1 YicC family protein [Defluviitoga sp.]HPZ28264.1 YicC family protein [Defluviitoga sp.]HQD62154.1 YicC family protein [Defluviitoga sp.]